VRRHRPGAGDDTLVHGLSEADVAGTQPFADEWDTFADLRERGPLAATTPAWKTR